MLFRTSRLLSAAGVAHGFSVRTGGVSLEPFHSLNLSVSTGDTAEAVAENTRRLAQAAGVEKFVTANQVHGDRIVDSALREVLPATVQQEPGADAVLTLDGAAVGVRVADCVPILLYGRDAGGKARAAAVHSGWRGTRLGIAGRAVQALGCVEPVAAIGPCIGRCCYEVSNELAALFRELFGPRAADDPARAQRPHLDLRHCVEASLRQAGLPADRIEQVEGCTSCDKDAFFSHRRDKGRTGRHLAFIAP